MKKILFSLAIICIAASCASGSDKGKSVSIFDGKTFHGWEGDTNTSWHIEENAIVGGDGKTMVSHNQFICTERQFTNFVLRIKFKLTGSEGFVNGGVQVRSKRVPNHFEVSGYQCDLGDPGWWGCLYDESRRNKVVAQSDMNEVNKVLKRGDWNQYEIHCDGKRIRALLNGLQTFDYTEPDNSIPQFGVIALQLHGGGKTKVFYKDISVEELP